MYRFTDIFRDVGVGSITALASIATTIGFSALIFSGPLAQHLSFGIYYGLISIVIATLIFAWRGSFAFAVAGPDSRTVSVLAAIGLVAADRISALPADSQAATLIMVMVMSSFICGLVLYAVGAAKLGRLVRFVPYTIIAGFLGASGWMLIFGTLRLLAGSIEIDALLDFFQNQNNQLLFASTILIALAIQIINLRSQSSLALPLTIVIAIIVIHAVMLSLSVDYELARLQNWFLPEMAELRWFFPLFSTLPLQTDWPTLFSLSGEIIALTIVCILTLLLSVAAIEVISSEEAHTDRELKVCGLSNIITSFFGGMVNTISLTRTILHYRAGGRSRFSLVVVGVLSLICICFGTEVISLFPVPVLAGLILMLGSGLVYEWLIETFSRVTFTDWLEILLIQIIILKFGFVAGVVMGLVVACISFVFNFSKINLIRLNLSRAEYGSNVERSLTQSKKLNEEGKAIQIFWLHGYIFFGSANTLVSTIKSNIRKNSDVIRIIIFDLKQVLGIDSSAIVSFIKLFHIMEREDLRLVLSNIPENIKRQMEDEKLFLQSGICSVHDDLDSALEWSEDRLLSEVTDISAAHETAESWLSEELGSIDRFRLLESYMQLKEYEAGEYLFHQGDVPDAMYIVISGRVTILLESSGKTDLRLRSFLGQTLVGEIGIYRDEERSASVKIDKPAMIYSITRESLERLHKEQPDVAIAFHMFVVRTVSARIGFSNKEIAELHQA